MTRKLGSRMTREIIRRLQHGQSIRAIQRETGTHRQVIRTLQKLAEKKGWLEPGSPIPEEKEFVPSVQDVSHPLDAYKEQLKAWVEKGLSYVVMHELLKGKFGGSLSALRHYVQSRFPKKVKPVMVRHFDPGEVIEIDFGYLGRFYDSKEKRARKVWVFSARLAYSRRAYRQLAFNQSIKVFLQCHVRAFEFFGGVPEKVVLDNLKSGVIRSTIDNDQINRAYLELAEYYGFLISPCRVRKPEHKGGVEGDIKYIKNNFLPLLKEKYPSFDVDKMQKVLEEWGVKVDQRVIYGVGRTPDEMFAEEATALKSLPENRWEPIEWVKCKVRKNWRVQCKKAYYSVPYQYIDEAVVARVSSGQVEIFFNAESIATHTRASKEWEYLRCDAHAPPEQEAVLQATRQGLETWAEQIGPFTSEATKILFDSPADRLYTVRRLLQLSKNFGAERMEAACQRALHYNTVSYQSVNEILKQGLDQEPLSEAPQTPIQEPSPRFARNPNLYQGGKP